MENVQKNDTMDDCYTWTGGEVPMENSKETREEQVIRYAADGYTDKEIAQNLGLSIDTVSTYWRRILVRTGCSSRTQVIAQVTKQKTEQHLVLISPRETTLGSYCADRKREKPDNFKQSHELNRPLNVDELDGYQILEKIHA